MLTAARQLPRADEDQDAAPRAAAAGRDLALADAEDRVSAARRDLFEAGQAEQAALADYERHRITDPTGPATDHARHAWAQALADQADARVALAAAADTLRAVHRQPTTRSEENP
ncbi:hypothetical protein [Actinomadura opuntiae]|uniref:hypothetical protein n=1 Tax=Actinomadura sp. OS1-43 TaxID=604315 RepID=UPI00255B286D|nr:hypothetical protein [Actinomadura sp. OS1-43]MDL4812752.1 hypothetical protein [Actinomadura sp. OS1-43]